MAQTCSNVAFAILALWSVISFIVIIVWATVPHVKDVGQCQADLQLMEAKLEEAKAVSGQNKVALEKMVLEGRDNQTRQCGKIDQLLMDLNDITESLNISRHENVILNGNITDLEKQIGVHKEMEANLTSEITLRQDHIDVLQQNLTQASHQREACQALQSAAESRKMAAESQTKACESSKLFLQKQMQKCKKEDPPAVSEQVDDGCTTPKASILAIALVLCTSLHLITWCDTVSTFAGRGKKTAWETWKAFPEVTEAFNELLQMQADVSELAKSLLERFVLLMYDRTSETTEVNGARKQLFTQKSRAVENMSTKAALDQHIKRATYQANVWCKALEPDLQLPSPSDWLGERSRDGMAATVDHPS